MSGDIPDNPLIPVLCHHFWGRGGQGREGLWFPCRPMSHGSSQDMHIQNSSRLRQSSPLRSNCFRTCPHCSAACKGSRGTGSQEAACWLAPRGSPNPQRRSNSSPGPAAHNAEECIFVLPLLRFVASICCGSWYPHPHTH